MDIKEALALFNITSLDELDTNDIKKKWKKAMLKVHPDAGGDPKLAAKYNNACEVLLEYTEKLKEYKQLIEKSKVEVCIITLTDLIKIYQGQVLESTITNDKGKQKSILSRENMNSKRVILNIPVDVSLNGVESRHECLVLYSNRDEYVVTVQLKDNDMFGEAEVKVGLYDKEISTKMTYSRMMFQFRFEYNILVYVQIERIEEHGQKDT